MKKLPAFTPCCILPTLALLKAADAIAWQIILGYLLCISIATYAIYWHDKRRATSRGWRIPENILHTFELLGGWPTAYLAQQTLRHKTAKRRYQIVFWLIVAAHQYTALDYLLNWQITGSAFPS